MTTKFITLNVWDAEPIRIKINQGEVDSRFLKVQFIDKNQPLNLKGKTVFFYAKKPDGNLIFNTCEVTNEKDGTINPCSHVTDVASGRNDERLRVSCDRFRVFKAQNKGFNP